MGRKLHFSVVRKRVRRTNARTDNKTPQWELSEITDPCIDPSHSAIEVTSSNRFIWRSNEPFFMIKDGPKLICDYNMHIFAELDDGRHLANADSPFSRISPRWYRTMYLNIPGSGMFCQDGQNCRISDPLYTLLCILSLGLIALFGELYPIFKIKLSKQECDAKDASCCLVELCSQDKNGEIVEMCVCWSIDRCQFPKRSAIDTSNAQLTTQQSRYGDLVDEEAEQVAMLRPQIEQELLIALQVQHYRMYACSELEDRYALHIAKSVTPGFARFLQKEEDLDSSHTGLEDRVQERALLRTIYGANSVNISKYICHWRSLELFCRLSVSQHYLSQHFGNGKNIILIQFVAFLGL